MDRKKELKGTLSNNWRHFLSHHVPEEYYRCYRLDLFGRTVRICARCLGIYMGIFFAIFFASPPYSVLFIALAPLPTFIEKYFTSLRDYKGYNFIRSGAGILLGIGYFQAIDLLLENPFRPFLWAVGFLYGAASAILIWMEHKRS